MNQREFDEFYLASYPRVTTQLYALTGNRDEAEECVQEAFARAWAHRRELSREAHPEAWVRTTARRLAISRWRRATKGRETPDRALAPDPATGITEDHVVLVSALRMLPASQRVALVLHHVADLSVADIARETNTKVGTVKARLSRGRAALATLLDDDGLADDRPEGASHA